jgi:hypothetical protein
MRSIVYFAKEKAVHLPSDPKIKGRCPDQVIRAAGGGEHTGAMGVGPRKKSVLLPSLFWILS